MVNFVVVCLMVVNATFSNISAISWRSVLLVEETGGLEKTTDLSQVTYKLYHIMLCTSPWSRFELTTSVVIGTDWIGSCKFNYHAITATTVPIYTRPSIQYQITRFVFRCLNTHSTVFNIIHNITHTQHNTYNNYF